MRGLKLKARKRERDHLTVASFTDAWIETHSRSKRRLLSMSHLLQMRGLKLAVLYGNLLGPEVASFTDAWIETF